MAASMSQPDAMASSQLMTIDAARVSSIIEDALEKLSFLASITPDVMAHRDELSQIVGDEITRIIHEQRALEAQYELLVGQRNALKAQSNKAKFQENQEAIRSVARALRESSKELARNLKGNPNIAENLTKIQAERAALQSLLAKTLRELRESSFATLTSTVGEEKLRTDLLLEVIENEKSVSAAVKQAQQQLADGRAQHETDVEERTGTVTRLKEELQDLRTQTSIHLQYQRAEARAHAESSARMAGMGEGGLREEAARLRTELEVERRANVESEDFLRRKWHRLQADIDEWSSRYEADLERNEQELERLNQERATDLIRLSSLQAAYEADVADKRAREQEMRAQAEAARTQSIELQRTSHAATLIQAGWRGWSARDTLKNGGKKGKKGKKGGKGKGKGKGKKK